jgi:hypothetical protein
MKGARESKKELEEKKIALEMKDCTFKPEISRPKRSNSAPRSDKDKPAPPSSGAVHERLVEYGKSVEHKRLEAAKVAEMKERQEATFKPVINRGRSKTKTEGINPTPEKGKEKEYANKFEELYRASKIDKTAKIIEQIKAEEEKICTFQPKGMFVGFGHNMIFSPCSSRVLSCFSPSLVAIH